MPSELMKYAMQPVIEALIAKQLLRHPDMDVNVSVACCISEVLRIMVYKTPYSDEQMKPVRHSINATRHTVNIDSEVEKKTHSYDDPSTSSTYVIEVSFDDDNEEMIDLTGKQWELHENVSATPDSVSVDNGDESFMDLAQEELVENIAPSVYLSLRLFIH
ncbi:phospholipase-like protein [Tanacetum coccineum]